jgi:hypothetical protein
MNLNNIIIIILMILILSINLYLVFKTNISESMSNKPGKPVRQLKMPKQ